MNIKDLNKLLGNLNLIDMHLLEISRYANRIKDGKRPGMMLQMKHESARYSEPDVDGDVMPLGSIYSFSNGIYGPSPLRGIFDRANQVNNGPKTEGFTLPIDEVIGLEVLGVVVAYLEARRMTTVRELTGLGIEVK